MMESSTGFCGGYNNYETERKTGRVCGKSYYNSMVPIRVHLMHIKGTILNKKILKISRNFPPSRLYAEHWFIGSAVTVQPFATAPSKLVLKLSK
jgi:hypothetical protein